MDTNLSYENWVSAGRPEMVVKNIARMNKATGKHTSKVFMSSALSALLMCYRGASVQALQARLLSGETLQDNKYVYSISTTA